MRTDLRRTGMQWLASIVAVLAIGLVGGHAHAGPTDSALAILEEMITQAEGVSLPEGVTRSLVAKLVSAKRSIEGGNIRAAFGQLGAFEAEVRAQRGKILTAEQADGALESARHVKIALEPGPPPMLKNLLVNFGPWDMLTNRAGDFVFLVSEDKVFLEFGAVVIGPEGPKTLPTFEYRVSPDAPVVSPIDGAVEAVLFQPETNDYELHLVSSPTSPFMVIVDHVTDLLVAEGDPVAAGQEVGKVGPFSPSLGRTELQIFNFIEETNYCPFELFDPELAPVFRQKVTNLMADWEAFKADASIYDQGAMVDPGCLSSTLPEL